MLVLWFNRAMCNCDGFDDYFNLFSHPVSWRPSNHLPCQLEIEVAARQSVSITGWVKTCSVWYMNTRG